MKFDLEALLKEVSPDAPTGENLEYDPSFAELERAAAGKPEQQMGASVVAAEPPNWDQVESLGRELLARSKDLRIAMPVLRARTNRLGLIGLAEGLALVRGLLERYWLAVYPELDPDDPTDATMRVSALAVLALPEVLAELKGVPIVTSRAFGSVSLRSIEESTDPATVGAAFQDAGSEQVIALAAAVEAAESDVAAIGKAFAGVSSAPDLASLTVLIKQAQAAAKPYLPVDAVDDGEGSEEGGDGARKPRKRMSGEVTSREDVVRVLDQVCKYYERYEPSSPLPILLERCKRLVSLNFMDIVKDMAPDALAKVEVIAGTKTEKK
jgi:type VI secretion system protein ImpA